MISNRKNKQQLWQVWQTPNDTGINRKFQIRSSDSKNQRVTDHLKEHPKGSSTPEVVC